MIYAKLSLIAALLLCLAPMPYGYYIFVRYFAAIIFGVMSYQCYLEKKNSWTIVFGALALLFQPFVKIPLGREIWNVVDVLVAVGLFVPVWREYRDKKKQKADDLVVEEADPFEPYEGIQKHNSCLVEIGHNYVFFTRVLKRRLSKLNGEGFKNSLLGGIKKELPDLKLEEGYEDEVRRLFSPEFYRIDLFKHIVLPFTEEAIWQVYLLWQTDRLIISPGARGSYESRSFINRIEDIEDIPLWGTTEKEFCRVEDKMKQCWSDDKQPLVVLDGDKAYISHYWFDHWKGLVQVKCLVKYDHQQHRVIDFFIKECDPVVPYHCGVLF